MRLRGPQAIGQAVDAARAFGEGQRLANEDLARLCIVVEELVANLYDHGEVTEQDEVQLEFARDPGGVRVSIIDPGLPFDPWSTPQTPESMKRQGGAGTSLVRAWANLLSYRSSSDGNHLELLLPLKPEQ